MSEFAVAFSENLDEKVTIREIALRIKSFLPRHIDFIIAFFTSHYHLSYLHSLITDMLRPLHVICIETPLIIYEGRVFSQGVVALAGLFSPKKYYLEVSKESTQEEVEISLRKLTRNIPFFSFILSFLSVEEPQSFLIGVKLGLGRNERFLTVVSKDEGRICQILGKKIYGKVAFIGWDKEVEVRHKKISGFIPLGRFFTFTKIDKKRRIILEIDNKPAFSVYRKYLGERIDIFRERKFFYLYPLGVKRNGLYRLIAITDVLDDESLEFRGEVEEGERGNIMILRREVFRKEIERISEEFSSYKVMLLVDSLLREKILKEKLKEEIIILKKKLPSVPLVGFYSDYCIDFDTHLKRFIVEEGNLHLLSFK